MLVTRARGQASALVELLEAEGAEAIVIPTIEIVEPESFAEMDEALGRLAEFGWVIFTSANAVEVFAARTRLVEGLKVAVIGPATGKAVERLLGRAADLMPNEFVAESLLESLLPVAKGAAMLLVRAAVARDVLPEKLRAAGARVTVVDAYRTVVPEGSVTALKELFGTRPPDAVTFTSGSTVRNLADLMALAGVVMPGGMVMASIGPVTSGVMREVGWEASVEAAEATIPALVKALSEAKASAP